MTINEIARIAGVSRATVSRYLNDGYVSDEKREKIRVVIERTGYAPSASAQNLRSGKTKCVGVIIPKINSDSIAQMVSGISSKLAENGFQLLLSCTQNDEKKELSSLAYFSERIVDGVIMLGTVFSKAHKTALSCLDVPFVILAQNLEGFPCVSFDDYGAGRMAGELLAKSGAKFGIVGVTQKDKAVGVLRVCGFLDFLKESDIFVSEDCRIESDFSFETARKKTLELLQNRSEIDSLFCATDTIALGAVVAARELGRNIPSSLRICGIGDSAIGRVLTPSLSTVHYCYEQAGIEAAKMLIERIENPKTPIKSVKLLCEKVKRESC